MSENYWDYWRHGTTSGSNLTPTDSSTSWEYRRIFDTTTTGSTWIPSSVFYPVITSRKILVHNPDNWTEEQGLKFVELVNIKTKTGWTVTLFIKGDVLITDPDVEKRTMEDFIPLLKKRASCSDIELINKFFDENKIN